MTFFMGDTEPDFAIPAGTEGSAGAQTGFLDNFKAAYTAQADVHSAFGADESMATLEQQQLDKLFGLTGERMSPLFPGAWSNPEPTENRQFAIMHSLAGDTLDAQQRAFMDDAQKQVDRYNKLATQNGLLTYDQMFKQVQQNARQAVTNAAGTADRSTAMGWLGGALGGAAGSMTYRDPINLATLALGGVGKTAIARVVSEMGVASLSQAMELLSGGAENQQLLTGKGPTAGEMAEQVAETALGAGIIRGGGEAVAKGFGALARRFGAKAPDVAAGAIAKEAEDTIGPSPYGPSRIAKGLHEAEVMDALARDVPMNRAPVADRLVEPPESGGKFPIAPLALPAADGLFNDTEKPLANLFDIVPTTPEMDRANAALASLTDEIRKADAAAAAADDTFAAANGGRTMRDEQRRLTSALDDNNASRAELRAKMAGAPAADGELAKALARLERERGALGAGIGELREAFAQQESAAAAAAHMRLVRSHMVSAIADAVPDAQRSSSVQALLDKSGHDRLRPIDRPPFAAFTADDIKAIETRLDNVSRNDVSRSILHRQMEAANVDALGAMDAALVANRASDPHAPNMRVVPASGPEASDMLELTSPSGRQTRVKLDLPTDHKWEQSLDQLDPDQIPIVVGTTAEYNSYGELKPVPIYASIREVLQEITDDDALVKAMNECLIA